MASDQTTPSECAMAVARTKDLSGFSTHEMQAAAVRQYADCIDDEYAPLVEAGECLKLVLVAYERNLPNYNQQRIYDRAVRGAMTIFSNALADATPKGGTDVPMDATKQT